MTQMYADEHQYRFSSAYICEICGLRQLDIRLFVPRPIQDGQLADRSRHLGVARLRKLFGQRFPLRGVVVVNAHFDQLVRVEGALRLFNHGWTCAGAADAHDRLERVREAAEELALLARERHESRIVAERYWWVVSVWWSGIFASVSSSVSYFCFAAADV